MTGEGGGVADHCGTVPLSEPLWGKGGGGGFPCLSVYTVLQSGAFILTPTSEMAAGGCLSIATVQYLTLCLLHEGGGGYQLSYRVA